MATQYDMTNAVRWFDKYGGLEVEFVDEKIAEDDDITEGYFCSLIGNNLFGGWSNDFNLWIAMDDLIKDLHAQLLQEVDDVEHNRPVL